VDDRTPEPGVIRPPPALHLDPRACHRHTPLIYDRVHVHVLRVHAMSTRVIDICMRVPTSDRVPLSRLGSLLASAQRTSRVLDLSVACLISGVSVFLLQYRGRLFIGMYPTTYKCNKFGLPAI
jgi:hypothetical protein